MEENIGEMKAKIIIFFFTNKRKHIRGKENK